MNADTLLAQYERIAEAPDAIARLRRFVLDLAVRGKLVPQDAGDEPAEMLLKRIERATARLPSGRRPRDLATPIIANREGPYEAPAGWVWVSFASIADFFAGRTPARNEAAYWNKGDYPWVSIADMKDGQRVDSTKETISASAKREVFGSEPVPAGTMIMSFKLTIGKIARLGVAAFHNEAIISVRPHLDGLDPYLFKVLPHFAKQGDAKGAIKGATLNRESLSNIAIPLPPLAEQHRIVAKVDELMALCDRLEAARTAREATRDRLAAASLARLTPPDPDTFPSDARFALDTLPALTTRPNQIKHLRQTILNLAVRGKLVAQDASDESASKLLERISLEKGKLARSTKHHEALSSAEFGAGGPFPLPPTWEWIPATYAAHSISDIDKKIQTKDILETGRFPVVDQGKEFIRGFFNDEKKVIKIANPVIIFGDHTRELKFIDFDFIVGADGVKILAPICIYPKYYFLALKWLPLEGRGYSRHFKMLKEAWLPLPPLAEQHRIVAKANELMALCDALEASLAAATTARTRLLDATLAEALAPLPAQFAEAAE